jgi:hypothetical protein
MWEWRFTVRPVSERGPAFVAVLFDQAETIDSISVWNEAGYGSSDPMEHTRWWQPIYRTLGDSRDQSPAAWRRF